MRLWFRPEEQARSEPANLVTLTEAFSEEIRTHPVPGDGDVVRALANNPGCLDLYTWLTWRCHRARAEELVPLFESSGLASQPGSNTMRAEVQGAPPPVVKTRSRVLAGMSGRDLRERQASRSCARDLSSPAAASGGIMSTRQPRLQPYRKPSPPFRTHSPARRRGRKSCTVRHFRVESEVRRLVEILKGFEGKNCRCGSITIA
jgi:hypothetical protein